MILPSSFPTYAQYSEDIILLALLPDIKKGFYIDVGANHPVIDSVTKLFYDQGWRGINIEPIDSLYRQLQKRRSRDRNLHLGVGEEDGELDFYENTAMPGHSHFGLDVSDPDKDVSYKVKVKTLATICAENDVNDIHFLKIDVEGFESKVIAGNDWALYRPEVLCIEANHKTSDWQDILVSEGYRLFISDGLNEYYVANESWSRTEGFADRAVKLSHRAIRHEHFKSWTNDSRQLKKLTELNQIHFDLLQQERNLNSELMSKINQSTNIISKIKRIVHKISKDS